jgi:hypothetical protein
MRFGAFLQDDSIAAVFEKVSWYRERNRRRRRKRQLGLGRDMILEGSKEGHYIDMEKTWPDDSDSDSSGIDDSTFDQDWPKFRDHDDQLTYRSSQRVANRHLMSIVKPRNSLSTRVNSLLSDSYHTLILQKISIDLIDECLRFYYGGLVS